MFFQNKIKNLQTTFQINQATAKKCASLIAIIFAFSLSGCSTEYKNPNLPQLTTSSDYFSMVEKNTQKKQIYDGFYATLEMSSTFLNTSVITTQLDHMARIYQWDVDQYNNKKAEMQTRLSKQTEFFVGFFVPERKNDDLHKRSTLWKIFLDAGGKRYEGKAEKIKTILADLQALYPHHTRFHTPYRFIFNVPTSVIEAGEAKLTITGPVGSASLQYNPATH